MGMTASDMYPAHQGMHKQNDITNRYVRCRVAETVEQNIDQVTPRRTWRGIVQQELIVLEIQEGLALDRAR